MTQDHALDPFEEDLLCSVADMSDSGGLEPDTSNPEDPDSDEPDNTELESLRSLAARGLVEEVEGGRFVVTPRGLELADAIEARR